jgi:hypothetical protein
MSSELKIQTLLRFAKGTVTLRVDEDVQYIDISGDHSIHRTQEIGHAAAETLDVGEVGTVGWCYFRNADFTNYVEIGYDDSGFKPTLKLKASEWCICRLGQDAPYAQADTAAVDLEYMIIED